LKTNATSSQTLELGLEDAETVRQALSRLEKNAQGAAQWEEDIRRLSDMIILSPFFDLSLGKHRKEELSDQRGYELILMRVEALQRQLMRSSD